MSTFRDEPIADPVQHNSHRTKGRRAVQDCSRTATATEMTMERRKMVVVTERTTGEMIVAYTI